MKINLEDIRAAQKVLHEFNELNLNEIEFYENGQPITISPKVIEEFKFMGLTNSFFIDFEFWKYDSIFSAPQKE